MSRVKNYDKEKQKWVHSDTAPVTPVDPSLKKPGEAADAFATGKKLEGLRTDVDSKLDSAPIGPATEEDTQEVHKTKEGKLVTSPGNAIDDQNISKETNWSSDKSVNTFAPADRRSTGPRKVVIVDDVSPLERSVECRISRINQLTAQPIAAEIIRLARPIKNPVVWFDEMVEDDPGKRMLFHYLNEKNFTIGLNTFKPSEAKHPYRVTATGDQYVYGFRFERGTLRNVMISEDKYSHYVPYIPDLSTVTVTQLPGNVQLHPDSEGNIVGFKSKYPSMSFSSDNPGALIKVEYIRDSSSYPSLPREGSGVVDYGLLGQYALSDGKGGIYWSSSKPTLNFDEVSKIVKYGLAKEAFPVGYEFKTRDPVNNQNITWRVVDHDNREPVDPSIKHTMELRMKHVWSNSGGTQIGIQFCAPQALYFAKEGLQPGEYSFTLMKGYDEAHGGGKTYKFTLASPVPAGGQLTFNWGYNVQASTVNIVSYGPYVGNESGDQIESVPVSLVEAPAGTFLGTADGTTPDMCYSHRIRYGSNNSAQSAYRQFTRSSAEAGSVWKPQTKFDRPPSWATSQAGFLKSIPADLMRAVVAVKIPCKTNDSTYEVESLDGTQFAPGQTYTLEEKFFPASVPEIFDQSDGANSDGKVLEYFKGLSAAERIVTDVGGTPRYVWLRSPNPWGARDVRLVITSGSLGSSYAYYSFGVSLDCVIG